MSNNPNKRTGPQPDWWHTDKQGRSIGWMWPEDFKRDLDAIWGVRKGIAGFAKYSGYNRTTVEKFCNGTTPIPKHVALLSQALIMLIPSWYEGQTAGNRIRNHPTLKASWLPGQEETNKFGVARRPFG